MVLLSVPGLSSAQIAALLECGCGDGVVAGLDSDGAVAPTGADELSDGPACLGLDPATDGQGGE
jgi:hypothetical protein